ncbi:hypothetical protein GX51_07206 [Blastomyces parvus]|uniref:CST complex subunit Ten1 n=1 Tax=Blastomyces parvus TaxID=2060905 RepID=A0A2B7WLQ4_9EURO|nr:hypothetical protein GX51_07206 [Blastomyces parvus]
MSQGPAGPLPTTRAFLSEIPSLPTGAKIRFLGCVSSYNPSTGHLTLEHNYPIRSRPPSAPAPPSIAVDINLLLESLTATDIQVGAWLNVLGYIRERRPSPPNNQNNYNNNKESPAATAATGAVGTRSIYIEAVMVFSADAVQLGEYERVLQDWQEADRRVQRPSFISSSSSRQAPVRDRAGKFS